jgi:hypothetical protein
MKKYLIILLALLFCGAEVSAKSYGGGSFRSSGFKSSGFKSSTPSYKPSAPAKTYTTAPSKPSTFTQQPVAPAKTVTPTPVVQVDNFYKDWCGWWSSSRNGCSSSNHANYI